jgi:sec-independent protein translocase protein TatC
MQDIAKTDGALPEPRREGQDEIDASRMPLMDHLIELRTRLLYSIAGVAVAFVFCFFFAKQIYNILVWPYIWARGGHQPVEMIFTHPAEFFFTELKLALFGAVCLAFPIIANQLYKFVAPGLYKSEKEAFFPYLIATPILFLIGALCVYFIVMPLAMKFFLSMEQTGGDVKITLQARVSEYLSLIMTMILGFGVCFQLPVILTLLARAGFIGAQNLKDFRRYAIVAIAAVAAVLSPPDPFSMIAMMAPTIVLYEASIFVVQRIENARRAREAARSSTA